MSRPAIVIVAFNRSKSLLRLLSSVSKAEYPEGELIPLCFCIDYQDSEMNREVVRIAEQFEWRHGPKEIIHQLTNLGLKHHILQCGDLTKRFGSVIMLEDDLFVSPPYYDYTKQALDFYEENVEIGGVSLYNHKLNISNLFKFEPLQDDYDVYFLQIASSWGQGWTFQQWRRFRNWLANNEKRELLVNMPDYILRWPTSSWLKLFIAYMVDTNKFFVYPRTSYSTNFGDAGAHFGRNNSIFQVPLVYSNNCKPRFCLPSDSLAVYDSFFEILPQIIRRLNPFFKEYEFDCDLYGLKKDKNLNFDIILTSKSMSSKIASFGLEMRPIELNVVTDCHGDVIYFGYKKDVLQKTISGIGLSRVRFDFFFGVVPISKKINNVLNILVEGFKKRINGN
jgi:hypothetical protein